MTVRLAWLVDANAVSEMMRPRPDPKVATFLDSIADEGLGIASVTVWEILNGIGRLDPSRRRRDLTARFRDLLDTCSRTGSWRGLLRMRRPARGSWRTSAGSASRWTTMFRTSSSPPRRSCAALLS